MVFIGSCTNSRIEDLRAAAKMRRRAAQVARRTSSAMVVPGSGLVKDQAEAEGWTPGVHRRRLRLARAGLLDVPGHEPRQADSRASAAPRPRTATSRAARAAAGGTHLMSPAMAAAAAIAGPHRRRQEFM